MQLASVCFLAQSIMILHAFSTTCQKSDQTPNLLLSGLSPISWATLCRIDKFPLPLPSVNIWKRHFGHYLLHILCFQKSKHAGAFTTSSHFVKLFLLATLFSDSQTLVYTEKSSWIALTFWTGIHGSQLRSSTDLGEDFSFRTTNRLKFSFV